MLCNQVVLRMGGRDAAAKNTGIPDGLAQHQNVQDVSATYGVRNLPLRTEFLAPPLFPIFPNLEPTPCRSATAGIVWKVFDCIAISGKR